MAALRCACGGFFTVVRVARSGQMVLSVYLARSYTALAVTGSLMFDGALARRGASAGALLQFWSPNGLRIDRLIARTHGLEWFSRVRPKVSERSQK